VLRSHIESHAPNRLEEIMEAVAAALPGKFGTGPIDAPMQAILFTSVRPICALTECDTGAAGLG
jgi:hypothetical protein